ncbi:prepilin peptidase [Microbacterium sp. STN6]|uniref:prepilin peptidase n=1 Tax=Microbacterium sp. STN6 TaxID=2995588 RepID=UPI002260A6A2|nr:prepilin peptidase [Microbacterium sp. STN6]MCX7521868.1 prepilin peptidase [Microbacterium sp. STN6]
MTSLAEPPQSLLARAAWQVPVALALAALAVVVVGWRPALVLPLYLASVTPELCRDDIANHRLPNALVVPGYAVAALGLAWQWLADGTLPWLAVGAGAASFAFLLLMNLAGGMGMGDVKLAGLLGLALGALGAIPALAGLVIGFMAGGAAGLVALVLPGERMLRRIPFGPYLLLGFWAALTASPTLA